MYISVAANSPAWLTRNYNIRSAFVVCAYGGRLAYSGVEKVPMCFREWLFVLL